MTLLISGNRVLMGGSVYHFYHKLCNIVAFIQQPLQFLLPQLLQVLKVLKKSWINLPLVVI